MSIKHDHQQTPVAMSDIDTSTPVGCAKLGKGLRTYEVEGIGPAL
jgi:hypothetical protein